MNNISITTLNDKLYANFLSIKTFYNFECFINFKFLKQILSTVILYVSLVTCRHFNLSIKNMRKYF